jgi:type VI secretion system secreted protein VgrG
VLTVTGDHAVAGTPMTVVRARTLVETPDESRGGHVTQEHRLWCVQASHPYRPRPIPKPRIHGIQRATVVGPEHIHVDEHGRVLLAFFWDISTDEVSDPQATDLRPTRRVPVSHGWAGPSHGFVTLPRCGDEVLVAYIDGDPDEPVVVGRVYNGVNRGEVKLPDDATQSLWRTQSSPAMDGFHEIRFEDKSGGEELHIEAQRLHTRLVKGAEQVNVQGNRDITVDCTETEVIHENHSRTVDGDETVAVGGNRAVKIKGDHTRKVDGTETIVVDGTRDLTVGGNQMDHFGADWLSEASGSIGRNALHHGTVVSGQANVFCASRKEETKGAHDIKAGTVLVNADQTFTVLSGAVAIIADSIDLVAGGSAISIDAGGVTITGALVRINS